jgi:hypothetical protein
MVLVALVALVLFVFSPAPVAAAATAAPPARAVSVVLTPEMLIGFASVILALLFDWLPGLKTWYDKFGDGQKRGLMAGLLVLITGAVFGLSCAGWLQTGWMCTGTGIQDAVFLLVLAIAINQGIHNLTKP